MLAELVARPYCLFRRCNKICLNSNEIRAEKSTTEGRTGANEWVLMWLSREKIDTSCDYFVANKSCLATQFKIFMCLWNKSHLNAVKLSVSHLSTHLCVWTDRHTDLQRETITPRHYRVAGYNDGKTTKCIQSSFDRTKTNQHMLHTGSGT